MTIPRGNPSMPRRLTDMVRDMIPFMRHGLSANEQRVAIYLRGNEDLYEGLKSIINSRIEGRAKLSVSSDPQECMARLSRDHELRMVLSMLESIYKSPLNEPADSSDGEQPL